MSVMADHRRRRRESGESEFSEETDVGNRAVRASSQKTRATVESVRDVLLCFDFVSELCLTCS